MRCGTLRDSYFGITSHLHTWSGHFMNGLNCSGRRCTSYALHKYISNTVRISLSMRVEVVGALTTIDGALLLSA